jgi:hypothetical protein
MKTLGNIFGALLALALMAALGYYGYIAAKCLVVLFVRLDFTVAVVTATATVALLLAAMIIAVSIRRASAQGKEAQLRPDKAEAYKLFLALWEDMMQPGHNEEYLVQLSRQMRDVNHMLLLHGSPAVLEIHAAMQSQSSPDARTQMAAAILAIRKDLGLESRGLEAKELVQLLLEESDTVNTSSRPGMHQDTQPRVSLAPN